MKFRVIFASLISWNKENDKSLDILLLYVLDGKTLIFVSIWI